MTVNLLKIKNEIRFCLNDYLLVGILLFHLSVSIFQFEIMRTTMFLISVLFCALTIRNVILVARIKKKQKRTEGTGIIPDKAAKKLREKDACK